jgi:hypothetical protein
MSIESLISRDLLRTTADAALSDVWAAPRFPDS